MAGSVNKVILVGNVGKDPESRAFQNGGKVVNLTLATSETWNDKATGERKEKTEWHRVVIFNERIAEVAEKYVKKGQKVYIEGSLQTRKWTDQQGQEKYTTEVVIDRFRGDLTMLSGRNDDAGGSDFASSKGGSGGGYEPRGGGGRQQPARGGGGGGGSGGPSWDNTGGGGDLDDEIPF